MSLLENSSFIYIEAQSHRAAWLWTFFSIIGVYSQKVTNQFSFKNTKTEMTKNTQKKQGSRFVLLFVSYSKLFQIEMALWESKFVIHFKQLTRYVTVYLSML